MSQYTTGELAKLCGVTVRTVQYYDTRGILVPSALSEGGRRLYSETDLKRMKVICFLRDLGLPINSIGQLLSEQEPERVIEILLRQQEQVLREEIAERQTKLERLGLLQKELKSVKQLSLDSISDIACNMENKKKLRKVRIVLLSFGIGLEVIEMGTLICAVLNGFWWLFAIGLSITVIGSVWLSAYYYKNVAYICPKCQTVFKPAFGKMFWATHTPTTRKLTCTSCGHRGFCVETSEQEYT